MAFDGQQEGERVLYEIRPHRVFERFALLRIVLTALIFLVIILVIGSQSNTQTIIYLIGIGIVVAFLTIGLWWNKMFFRDTRAYVTDRRIMRFERVSPFIVAKRALFWNEALKAKAYEPNFLLQSMKIGSLIIEPQVQTEENVIIKNVHYAGDLANYIDKILFTFKNTPGEINALRPFVPKPRGQRDTTTPLG